MPSGDDGTLEALKCAACSCHRNFHRKDHHGESHSAAAAAMMAFGGGGGSGGTDSSSEELNFNPSS
ncbi:zinc-finger homeodomain protein 2 [Phtheirospermum japonicum]|uniref:Zinc-finger homeodomain protein 2 n=1 Tax=Phtheirospermum japonicum TaxID=374723 RepID=A0A830CVW9_9LAMI|nr:zinc-finger homeodomain protein 2 [Phtheirospermum japonicum]